MKSIAILLSLLAFCRVTDAAELQYTSWGEAKALSRADGKPIVCLMCADWCAPCRTMKNEILPALYRKGLLKNAHVCIVDVDQSRALFDSLKQGTAIPQLLITDLTATRVHVGAMSENQTYQWLRGK